AEPSKIAKTHENSSSVEKTGMAGSLTGCGVAQERLQLNFNQRIAREQGPTSATRVGACCLVEVGVAGQLNTIEIAWGLDSKPGSVSLNPIRGKVHSGSRSRGTKAGWATNGRLLLSQ